MSRSFEELLGRMDDDVFTTAPANFTCGNLTDNLRHGEFWFYLLSAVVVAIIGGVIVDEEVVSGFYESFQRPGWAPPEHTALLIWSILGILFAYAGYRGHVSAPPGNKRIFNTITYGVVLALGLLFFYQLYQRQDLQAAMWSLVALLAALVWFLFLNWNVDMTAVVITLLYIGWVIFTLAYLWQIDQLN
jgi:tryptophan-rich sensory protein